MQWVATPSVLTLDPQLFCTHFCLSVCPFFILSSPQPGFKDNVILDAAGAGSSVLKLSQKGRVFVTVLIDVNKHLAGSLREEGMDLAYSLRGHRQSW